MIGGSNSSVAEGSGLLVYDTSFDGQSLMFWERTVVFFFRVKQSKKNSWAASPWRWSYMVMQNVGNRSPTDTVQHPWRPAASDPQYVACCLRWNFIIHIYHFFVL